MDYTRQLVEFVLDTKYDQLPDDAISLAKQHFLDCVGALQKRPNHDLILFNVILIILAQMETADC